MTKFSRLTFSSVANKKSTRGGRPVSVSLFLALPNHQSFHPVNNNNKTSSDRSYLFHDFTSTHKLNHNMHVESLLRCWCFLLLCWRCQTTTVTASIDIVESSSEGDNDNNKINDNKVQRRLLRVEKGPSAINDKDEGDEERQLKKSSKHKVKKYKKH